MKKLKIAVISLVCIGVASSGMYAYLKKPKTMVKEEIKKSLIKKQVVKYEKPAIIDKFFDEYFRVTVDRDPETISYLGDMKKYGVSTKNDELTDFSERFIKETEKLNKEFLKDLKSYDKSGQTETQKLSSEVLEWYLNNSIDGEKFDRYNYVVNQFNGKQSDLIDYMISLHDVKNIKDAEDYVARLSKFDSKIDLIIEQVKLSEKAGVIPPEIIVDETISQINMFTSAKANYNELYTTFKDKLSQVKDISEKDKTRLCNEVEKQIDSTIIPSYKKLNNVMKNLKTKAPKEVGVWKLPDGDKYYEYLLKKHTSTNLSPEEVHNLGLKEVERIQGELKKLFVKIGYTGDDISQGVRMCYSQGIFGQETFDKYKLYLDEVDKKIPEIFDIKPITKLKLEAVPKYKEQSFPNAYMPGSLDGSRPGVFLVNLSMNGCKESMKPLAYHEGVPGHHFQLSIQNEIKDIPVFRKNLSFTAFEEGWALYAETLANEYGLYDDVNSQIGYLQSQLYRAGRMVVDTGIHYKKWTREQAAEYMIKNCATGNMAEIDRYIVYPGQACSYMVGELKILELREKAKKELGSKFNIKEFHNVVLKNGSIPFDILEKEVNKYIVSKK